MNCVWRGQILGLDSECLLRLSPERITILEQGSNDQFLDILAELALDAECTGRIYASHEPLFVEICSRWMSKIKYGLSPLSIVAAITRVLPFAPSLSIYIEEIACRRRLGDFASLFTRDTTALLELPQATVINLLNTTHRLMNLDSHTFGCLVPTTQLQVLLRNASPCIKYLSAKLLCIYVHASDSALASMVESFIGADIPTGSWDDQVIDYRFLSLWEQKRFDAIKDQISFVQRHHTSVYGLSEGSRVLSARDLSENTLSLAEFLVPSLGAGPDSLPANVSTDTSKENLRTVAEAICDPRPTLVIGIAGCGKTSIVRHIACALNKLSTLVTLHLNEQTDAKALVGLYTSEAEPGSFKWQPGILTSAVQEGRWVLIEDLDRAPSEVIGTLLPLVERRELLVPNSGGWIRASPGFKLLASIRSVKNARMEEITPGLSMLGIRHWNKVDLCMLSDQDLRQIVQKKYPLLNRLESEIFGMYSILKTGSLDPSVGLDYSIGTRALLRFCARLETLLRAAGIVAQSEAIPETLYDHIFLEAVDCFSASADSNERRSAIIDVIAQELHMSKQRMHYCLDSRTPEYHFGTRKFRIGRVSLSKRETEVSQLKKIQRRSQTFALTPQSLRNIESMGMAIKMGEPCLLVGETGIGKTAMVQELAALLHHPLLVINLSQQTEASDLVGGFKPLNVKALVIPLKDEFDDLFDRTFSSAKNDRFLRSINKALAKSDWSRALALWREAFSMVQTTFREPDLAKVSSKKRRKMETPKYQELKSGWGGFMGRLETVETRLRTGEKGMAFSFVEGSIIKAVRSGGWVLLDEINLASPDTLETIADLLNNEAGNTPSILLSDTGNIQKIDAHPSFRIFGSMNPATDIGKRDLPPGIRSRFTEFYIRSPEEDSSSLLLIITAYLHDHVHDDISAPSTVAKLYLEIRKLEMENQLVDGAEQRPHFSLRTLTRVLTYATDKALLYGLRRALFEGFSMCFLTLLNRESCAIVSSLIETSLLGAHKNRRALLHQVPRRPTKEGRYIQFRHYWMPQGSLPVEKQEHYIITPSVEANLLNLVRATSSRRYPILLQGPTSSGKTSMVEYLAKSSGNKFVRINNHEHTDLQEYLGTYISSADGLRYQEGVLVQALREGHWIVLDELNLAPTDVLEALNRLLDDNRELLIPETQEIVRPHVNFMLFATQNPPGLYGGRKMLSRAFRNRFLELHFDDIPESELETILVNRSQIAPSFCSRIVAVYKGLSVLRQSNRVFEQKNSFATLRDLFRWALRRADNREELANNGFMLLAERVRSPEERQAVKEVIENVMKVKIDEKNLYGMDELRKITGTEMPANFQGIVWTQSCRRLFILVWRALLNNEPVLLVGPTGCGKTSICQLVAKVAGTRLRILNAHQNTETGDIIGSQRPLRNRMHIEEQLRIDLTKLFEGLDSDIPTRGLDLPSMLEAYQSLNPEYLFRFPQDLRHRISENLSRIKALFEWYDGSLVQAMKSGEYFLLDEISLADDSVLERLNSVLEPSRSLLLAEKGSIEASVKASNNFQFLATMNPGGDYGKKELSLALRNRFTEIWVPPLAEREDILKIVQERLNPLMARFANPMFEFALWFSTNFTDLGSALSIRDLLAWVVFINATEPRDQYSTILSGATMVYIDGLGANPSARISLSKGTLKQDRQSCFNALSHIFKHDYAYLQDMPQQLVISDSHLTLGDVSIARRNSRIDKPDFSLEASTTRANAEKVLRALQLRKPILLEGNPGVGKTALVSTLALVAGVPLTRVNLSDQTDLMDLFGSEVPVENGYAGQFEWRDAPFLKAMRQGEWVLLDEMNLASQSILEGLNACLDHRGEVYIPELEQTFLRHPDFVVFAAQNPHTQGGGRKGLPMSFVNRFTVLYTDVLTAEDLTIICNQLFPETSLHEVGQLVHFVISLAGTLSTRGNSFLTGGPWEFNLRDILRWLHLLHSKNSLLVGAGPSDFVQMLFVDRLRMPGDVAMVKDNLSSHVLTKNPAHTYYSNLGRSWFQCGFGLLPRSKFSPGSGRFIGAPRSNLLESVMVCIQQSWPCLLVGPSGSGKTRIIYHLSALVGANVVELPLNSDTDTVDIIGGYEQVDKRRKHISLLKRLDEALQTLVSSNPAILKNNILLLQILDLCREKTEPSIHKIFESLSALCETELSGTLMSLHAECLILMQQVHEDVRARFEWVDGILIEALSEGRWLVLDNANLCNASVLDRLNALLEPNGVLVVNEHRSSDGSSRVIKPHPDFRLFLTMDPSHGELSRAMRNRCIEIYLSDHKFPSQPVSHIVKEAALSRFQVFSSFDWHSYDDTFFVALLTTCFENLAFSDFHLLRDWFKQVCNGLLYLDSKQLAQLRPVFEAYCAFLSKDSGMRQMVINSYRHRISELGLHSPWYQDSEFDQPLNLLNNAPLQSLLQQKSDWELTLWLAEAFEIRINLLILESTMSQVAESLRQVIKPQLSGLERSILSRQNLSFSRDSTQPLESFLLRALESVSSWLDAAANTDLAEDAITIVRALASHLRDVFDVGRVIGLNDAIFQAHLEQGRNLANLAVRNKNTRDLGISLIKHFELFNSAWMLSTGGYMELLWNRFRPATVETTNQLRALLELEALADKFDNTLWRSNSTLETLAKYRESFISAGRFIKTRASGEYAEMIEGLKVTLEEAANEIDLYSTSGHPFFQNEFEGVRQYLELASQGSRQVTALNIVAGRETRHSMVISERTVDASWLFKLRNVSGIDKSHNQLYAIRQHLPIAILTRLGLIQDIDVASLEVFDQELKLLSKSAAELTDHFTYDHSKLLNQILGHLHRGILAIPSQYHNTPPMIEYAELLRGFFSSTTSIDPPLTSIAASGNSDGGQFQRVMDEYLLPSLRQLIEASNSKLPYFAQSGEAWMRFFIGLLLLYVPDRIFDPALKTRLKNDLWVKRMTELKAKSSALKRYETFSTGQKSNLRCEILENRIADMGKEPDAPRILRPEVSQLHLIQGEYNNIFESVLKRLMSTDASSANAQACGLSIHDLRLVKTNISQILGRISQQYREYDDIMEPLSCMLQGLDIGLSLSLIAEAEQRIASPKENSSIQPQLSNPILGIVIEDYQRLLPDCKHLVPSNSLNAKSLSFNQLNFERIASQTISKQSILSLHDLFQSFYEIWDQKLADDQMKHATESSMYRYRGNEEQREENTQAELLEIFPDYENFQEQALPKSDINSDDPQLLTKVVAGFHQDLFQDRPQFGEMLLEFVENISGDFASSYKWHERDYFPISPKDMACSLLLALDKAHRRILHRPNLVKDFNFYVDTNIGEVRNLMHVLRQTEKRFIHLKKCWPEHATLDDVLSTVKDLFGMSHTSPIAEFLAKTEKLHGYIYEWQGVASREFTAAQLYDQLTALIISWRRLELSTWAKLLNTEDDKCITDSKSWWFIAYNLIIRSSMAIQHDSIELGFHIKNMISELRTFLARTPRGQFVARLQLLETFSKYASLLSQVFPSMMSVHSALVSFVRFYSRYSISIQGILQVGRDKCERELKEIVLLASWKDTNITALRESAKRSHHKLFKMIRRYRALLAVPIEGLIDTEAPMSQTENGESMSVDMPVDRRLVDHQALLLCKERTPVWQQLPSRYRDAFSTAHMMASYSRPTENAFDYCFIVDSFSTSLTEAARLLRKETPPVLTTENKNVVQHLKSRKRKLFSDTLKDLRTMGFRSNVDMLTLSLQNDQSVILATLKLGNKNSKAETHLFSTIDNMAIIRASSKGHSEDLTTNEVSRGLGYMESILEVILRQRSSITTYMRDFDSLDEHVTSLISLWDPENYTCLIETQNLNENVHSLATNLSWVRALIYASCIILEKHEVMGGMESSFLRKELHEWMETFSSAQAKLSGLPSLPTGLFTTKGCQIYTETRAKLEDFRNSVIRWEQELPPISFVLSQLIPWTDTSSLPSIMEGVTIPASFPADFKRYQHLGNGANFVTDDLKDNMAGSAVSDSFSSLTRITDSMLVATQNLKLALEGSSISNDENGWLVKTNSAMIRALKSFHLRQINEALSEAMSMLRKCTNEELTIVTAFSATIKPIVLQYRLAFSECMNRYLCLHSSLCRMACILSQSLKQVVTHGFCSPEESSKQNENSAKLEDGTGLGEGEGAEDISKDIKDDEDLSDLAQEQVEENKGEELEDQEDAVNMNQSELEGKMDDDAMEDEEDQRENEGNTSEEDELDEEVESVNDLDRSAVDEKMWDGDRNAENDDKVGDEKEGKPEDDMTANDKPEQRTEGGEELDECEEPGADEDEDEQMAKQQEENIDPHIQNVENLDLPDDMDLDNQEDEDNPKGDDLDSLSDFSQSELDKDDNANSVEDNKDEEMASVQEHQDSDAATEVDAENELEINGDAGSVADTEPEEDGIEDQNRILHEHNTESQGMDEKNGSDAQGLEADDQEASRTDIEDARATGGNDLGKDAMPVEEQEHLLGNDGEKGKGAPLDLHPESKREREEAPDSKPLQRLGNALEKWHRLHQEIKDASEEQSELENNAEQLMNDSANQRFEHLLKEELQTENQALAPATDEQAHALNKEALEFEIPSELQEVTPEIEETTSQEDSEMKDLMQEINSNGLHASPPLPSTMVANRTDRQPKSHHGEIDEDTANEDVQDLDDELSSINLDRDVQVKSRSEDEARQLWLHFEGTTRNLSLSLTEQLRLILAPTLASKLRGDFRSGKRLNIKRIIPYIASQFKRDKIWMRRSIPSKRDYQIMLAVDDSISMNDNGSGKLAFETLALVSKSLSMLEVGQICVVGFGESVRVAHAFDQPFSAEAGAHVLQQFTFGQTNTNVQRLLSDSLELFRQARLLSFSSRADTWQLQLIVSDGIFERHESVRRLVRQAHEERVMILFVIVDAMKGEGKSIMNMSEATFETDDRGVVRPKIKRYLEDFPFGYYLIVHDIKDLPKVLSIALRQWFAEVAGSS